MKNKKPQIVFSISKGYSSCTAWCGNPNGERMCRLRLKPGPKLDRKGKYAEIHRFLKSLKVPVPPYKPANKEIQ